MKPKHSAKVLLMIPLLAGTALVVWRNSHSVPKARSLPPVEKLQVFSLTNAPVAAGVAWSSHWSGTSNQMQIMQQVAAQVRAAQPLMAAEKQMPAGFRDQKQVAALQRLQGKVGGSLQAFLRNENRTVMQLKGHPLAEAVPNGGDEESRDEATAKTFLRENAALLLIDNADGELRLAHRQADPLGGTTLRFTQHYQGLPVWPAEIGVHLDANGNVRMVDGAYVETPNQVVAQPALTATEAEEKAQAAVSSGEKAVVGTPELVVYAPMDAPSKLAWKMEVSAALDEAWWVVIDAQNGETLATISRVMTENVGGSGVDLLGVTRPLNVWRKGSTYYMIDASKPMFNAPTGNGFIEIDDAFNQTTNQILSNSILQNICYTISSSPTSWSNPDAVSAAHNLSQTYNYYLERFGRNSFNDYGSNLLAVVRLGGLYNAFWNDFYKRMFFGNADKFVGSLDIVGHELTHGICYSIGSQGVLKYQDQSGALNEAFSDVFGEMIEARAKGTNDWLIGSQLSPALRSMSNPTNYGQPATMSQFVITTQDHGGVHINSGIINRAYFLLAAGLKGAIGHRDAEQIFYRCLTVSMKPFSQFIDTRLGCVAAAENLFGTNSPQALKTAEAFDSVELYAAPISAPQPTNVNAAVAAPDSAMFIREHWFYDRDDLFRLETAQGDASSGSSLVTNIKLTRPAITGSGSNLFLVGLDEGLYAMQTTGSGFTSLGYTGWTHSVAVDPQRRYIAFVFNASSNGPPTNQIVLLDVVSNLTSVINLVTPVSDGEPLNNISHADQLNFSPDGKFLIYDALSRLRGADGQLREAYSVFLLDMETRQQRVIVPASDLFNIGNPSFSRTSSRFIVFDAQYTNGNSAILTLDVFQGALGRIGVSTNGVGYPVFNGDDGKVFFASESLSTSSKRSIYAQQLTVDKMKTNGILTLAISDAKLAVIYRRGAYPAINNAPLVTLTSPAPNAVFTAPATVTVLASAGDIDGITNIARVEFYSGDKPLFTNTVSPYEFIWSNLPAGVYSIYARAYDNQGASDTTSPLRFTVKPPALIGVMNRAGAPGFEFSLRLPTNGLYRLETSTNLVDWVSLGSFYCSTNLGYMDSSATNFPRRFYRAVSTP